MEVYNADMLVISKRSDHTKHLHATFELLSTYGMKLNSLKFAYLRYETQPPKMCFRSQFGVSSGKFLGFMVTQRGIKDSYLQKRSAATNWSAGS